jgi:hypothetical protein
VGLVKGVAGKGRERKPRAPGAEYRSWVSPFSSSTSAPPVSTLQGAHAKSSWLYHTHEPLSTNVSGFESIPDETGVDDIAPHTPQPTVAPASQSLPTSVRLHSVRRCEEELKKSLSPPGCHDAAVMSPVTSSHREV